MSRRAPSTKPLALAELTNHQREQAMGRFAVLKPHLEEEVPSARAAAAAGIPAGTAERWLARYRTGGLAGLARVPRADVGRSGAGHARS